MRWQQEVSPLASGGKTENSHGNGSLMRILPMAYCAQWKFPQLIARVHQVSGITHAHLRSQIACLRRSLRVEKHSLSSKKDRIKLPENVKSEANHEHRNYLRCTDTPHLCPTNDFNLPHDR